MSSLIDALMRKSRRALRSARLDLRDGDTDGAVNRSYYAMANAAQAALLSSGVPEDKLPRTHSGLISAFGEQAVKSGKVDPEFGRAISKTESLRLRADYTGVELDLATAEKALAGAERFVQAVEHVYGLQSASANVEAEPHAGVKKGGAEHEGIGSTEDKYESMEELRSRGVREWLELQKRRGSANKDVSREKDAGRAPQQSEGSDIGRDLDDDTG